MLDAEAAELAGGAAVAPVPLGGTLLAVADRVLEGGAGVPRGGTGGVAVAEGDWAASVGEVD